MRVKKIEAVKGWGIVDDEGKLTPASSWAQLADDECDERNTRIRVIRDRDYRRLTKLLKDAAHLLSCADTGLTDLMHREIQEWLEKVGGDE